MLYLSRFACFALPVAQAHLPCLPCTLCIMSLKWSAYKSAMKRAKLDMCECTHNMHQGPKNIANACCACYASDLHCCYMRQVQRRFSLFFTSRDRPNADWLLPIYRPVIVAGDTLWRLLRFASARVSRNKISICTEIHSCTCLLVCLSMHLCVWSLSVLLFSAGVYSWPRWF